MAALTAEYVRSRIAYDPEIDKVHAARVYDAAASRLHGEFASLNFPEECNHGE